MLHNKFTTPALRDDVVQRHFAVTANTRPEHTLLPRQSRCLQGVCKCRSAAISHSVVVKVQFCESGVRLLIFHSTPCKRTSGCTPAVTHHCTSIVKVYLRGNACEDASDVCATQQDMSFYPSLTHDAKTLSRDTSKARDCHATSTFAKQVSKQWHLDRCATVQLSQPCAPNSSHVVSMPGHVMLCGYVERDNTSSRQSSGATHSPMMGNVTLTRISSKLPVA